MKTLDQNFSQHEDGFEGAFDGYVVNSDAEQVLNWLVKIGIPNASTMCRAIQGVANRVFVIRGIDIEEAYRNEGFGDALLDSKIKEASADVVILECDLANDQEEGFDLLAFYQNRDFAIIHRDNDQDEFPLMVHPSHLAEEIRRAL